MSGWISIHRKIQDHWLWKEKPFDKRSAWIDLLMMVNHEDKTMLLGNELIEVKRGSRVTSIRQLCDRWGWSNTKVKNFLNLLEKDNMLIVKSDTKKTTISIVNYNDYQDNNDSKSDTRTTEERHENDTKATRKHTNNNDNNDNNDNKNSVCMYDENLENISKLYEENIGMLSPIIIEQLKDVSEEFPADLFKEALMIAVNRKKRYIKYVIGVLDNWKSNNILTADDLEAFRREKEHEIQERQQKQKQNKTQYSKPKKTRFHNFEQRTDKYSENDLEAIADRKRQEYMEKLKKQSEAL